MVTNVGRTHKDPGSLMWMGQYYLSPTEVTNVPMTHNDPGVTNVCGCF